MTHLGSSEVERAPAYKRLLDRCDRLARCGCSGNVLALCICCCYGSRSQTWRPRLDSLGTGQGEPLRSTRPFLARVESALRGASAVALSSSKSARAREELLGHFRGARPYAAFALSIQIPWLARPLLPARVRLAAFALTRSLCLCSHRLPPHAFRPLRKHARTLPQGK